MIIEKCHESKIKVFELWKFWNEKKIEANVIAISEIIDSDDFVQGLSILSRGSIEEKLRWTFSLYDINGDGYITREEMTDIVTAIYELMGRLPDELPEEEKIKGKVEHLFEKMDINRDGVVTLDEFLQACHNDEAISRSMSVFDTAF
ncbi:hypothetical protein GQX74_007434 [Glossina fuscipes]|nr:hypothetical protein GQX74_007434 [Glossina fuscipes]